jgi:ATP-dependent Clp protease ATP-binding subunit ClpA
MFERFTDQARRVVVQAQEEARMRSHNYICTEHILLGLVHEGPSAARPLESLGISLETVRRQVDKIIGRGQQEPAGHIAFTPRAKRVLELAAQESRALRHAHVGTEHILLGLIRESDGLAAQVLVKLGADQDRVRQQVIQLRHEDRGQDVIGEGSPTKALDHRLAAIERWVGMRPDLDDLNEEIRGQFRAWNGSMSCSPRSSRTGPAGSSCSTGTGRPSRPVRPAASLRDGNLAQPARMSQIVSTTPRLTR